MISGAAFKSWISISGTFKRSASSNFSGKSSIKNRDLRSPLLGAPRRSVLAIKAVAEAEKANSANLGSNTVVLDNSADAKCTVIVLEGANKPGE